MYICTCACICTSTHTHTYNIHAYTHVQVNVHVHAGTHKYAPCTERAQVGMLHYELQPQSQLLFLAITVNDLAQSNAFAFLHQLRTRFFAQFESELATRQFSSIDSRASALLASVCEAHQPQMVASPITPPPAAPRVAGTLASPPPTGSTRVDPSGCTMMAGSPPSTLAPTPSRPLP